MTAAWLIAEREFRAYVATASFWVALVIGPLVTLAALALVAPAPGPARPLAVAVAVRAVDPVLLASASAALAEAGALEGRRIVVGSPMGPCASLDIIRLPEGGLDARFSGDFPLSASGRALVVRTIERDLAWRRLQTPSGAVRETGPAFVPAASAGPAMDAGTLSRFTLVMILWLTLTGSLGMLLQSVVRERGNRALEGLLAAVRPWEIVVGKLVGVGAVSALLLAAWLGMAAGLAAIVPGGGVVQVVIAAMATPAMLARAAGIYVLAFAFYGVVTVAVGASARDSAAAQNLSRPMFAVLLAAFFATIASLFGPPGRLDWLVYVPPFTPFVLLLRAPEAMSAGMQVLAVGLTLAATAIAGRVAVGRMTLSGAADRGPAA